MILKTKYSLILFLLIGFLISSQCASSSQKADSDQLCETYECRRKAMVIFTDTDTIALGEVTRLNVRREKFFLPSFRVFVGNYDSDFQLPSGEAEQYFDGSDSLAFLALSPESKGLKVIRGIVEEYEFINEELDSVNSFRYPFEIGLFVK